MNKKTITTAIAVCGFVAAISVPLIANAGRHCMVGKSECTTEHEEDSRIQSQVSTMGKNHDASDDSDRSKPLVAPINSLPAGQSYGRWAAEWWQWAYGTPAAVNPVADTTGEHCAQRQVDKVWFLAGSFSSNPVTRNCTIPARKSLFFPLINTAYGAFLNDSPETRTEDFIRAAGSCTEPAHITVRIDNYNVPKPTQFFTGKSGSQSPFFNIQLPVDNIAGLHDNTPNVAGDVLEADELVLSPSAEQGYYLFLKPLSAGAHTIHFKASGCNSIGFTQNITYNLTVLGDGTPHHH